MPIQDRYPISDHSNDYVYWYPTSGGIYDKIDEETPDDGSTNVYTWISETGTCELGFSVFNVTGSVNSLLATFRMKRENSHCTGVRVFITVNGTKYYGNWEAPPSGTWTTCWKEWVTNPDTGSNWEVDDINGTGSHPLQYVGLQIAGYYSNGYDYFYNRVTQLLLTCDYTAVVYEYAAGTMSGGGTLAGSCSRTRLGSGALSGLGTISGAASKTCSLVIALAGAGFLSAIAITGTVFEYGTATMSAIGTMVGSALRYRQAAGSLTGSGILQGLGKKIKLAVVTLAGVGSLTARMLMILVTGRRFTNEYPHKGKYLFKRWSFRNWIYR